MSPESIARDLQAAEEELWSPEWDKALTYLRMVRGLSDDTIRAARLGYTASLTWAPWRPQGIVIPWWNGGRLALVKVRPPERWRGWFPEARRPPKYIEAFRDPSLAILYPDPEAIRPGRPLVVVEGEFDRLLLAQELGDLAGVVTLGSASTGPDPALRSRLLPAWPWYIATDSDEAGDQAAGRWPASARRVRPPAPHKDWTEAEAGGVDLRRWWRDILAGVLRPPPSTRGDPPTRRLAPGQDDAAPIDFPRDRLRGPHRTPWGTIAWSDPDAPPIELFGPP